MEEIWKPVVGYEGYYEISNLGRVKSVERLCKLKNGTIRKIKEAYRKIQISKTGYKYVLLCKDNKNTIHYIHRLIAIAFIPNPENKPCIDHVDTNPSNNNINNLRWVTEKENTNNELTIKHYKENIYIDKVKKKILETRKIKNTSNSPKTVYQYTKQGAFIDSYFSMEEAERKTGASHINEVIDDNTLSAGGFLWTSKLVENIKYIKRKKSKVRAIQLYDYKGNLISEWNTITEAAKSLKISSTKISRILKYGNSKDYIFKYKQGA